MKLSEVKNRPNEKVISLIEGLLERAKSGDIQNIVAYGSDGDGCLFNQFSITSDFMAVLGEARLVERDLIDLYADIRKNVSWDFCNV